MLMNHALPYVVSGGESVCLSCSMRDRLDREQPLQQRWCEHLDILVLQRHPAQRRWNHHQLQHDQSQLDSEVPEIAAGVPAGGSYRSGFWAHTGRYERMTLRILYKASVVSLGLLALGHAAGNRKSCPAGR